MNQGFLATRRVGLVVRVFHEDLAPARRHNRCFVAAILLAATMSAVDQIPNGAHAPLLAAEDGPHAKNAAEKRAPDEKESAKKSEGTVIELFDGKTLKGWKATEFGGEGKVYVKDGQLFLTTGADLTGVTWQDAKTLPKSNYEVTLEAMRVEGSDFFCGLTFPVKNDPCSLIIGGWGGGVCGLSSLDGMDASENQTTTYKPFESGRWYRIRLRVLDDRIDAWIDDEHIVDVDITGRKISVRIEVELSRPFGIASWQTTAALRNIKLKRLAPKKAEAKPQ